MSPNDRLAACWRINNCNACINSNTGCGWCPYSSTCIPTTGILEPITRRGVCPWANERYELRTKTFGCACSTTTLLSIIVTIFATLAAFALLYVFGILVWRLNKTLGTGSWGGVEVELKSDGARVERQWYRGGWLSKLKTKSRQSRLHGDLSEQDIKTERSRLLG